MLTQLGDMLAYLEGYVGRFWGLCRPIWRPMLGHVDLCGTKRSEKWEEQKNTVKHRIFWGRVGGLSWGAILEHLGSMLADLGGYIVSAWGYMGPFWNYVGPCWGYVGPFWRLYWPILGLCSPFLIPILVHVDPSWPTSSKKEKKCEEHKTP